MTATTNESTRALAARRAHYLAGLYWHLGAFAIINGFFWLIDLTLGDAGVDWAYWITAVWGFGLAFHLLAYVIDGRQLVARKTEEYAEQTPERTPPG